MKSRRTTRRDWLAILAAVAVPLLFTAVLVPFRARFPNTDAALALMLAVVGVAASGYRLAGVLAAVSAAVWFDFFLTPPYGQVTLPRTPDLQATGPILVIGGARPHRARPRRPPHPPA